MKELLEKYPKAAKIVKEYYLNKLLEGLKDKGLPEDFKDHVKQQGLPEEQIVKLLEVNPIALTEIFDKYKLIICINGLGQIEEEVSFIWSIFNGIGHQADIFKYETRKKAEEAAIIEAFKLLEDKL